VTSQNILTLYFARRNDLLKAQPTASHFINVSMWKDTAGTPMEYHYPPVEKLIGRWHSATPSSI